jgi:outer membrane protein assembly factor BamB
MVRRFWSSLIVTGVLVSVASVWSPTPAADWTQFRGPGGRAQSDATDVPTTWDAETNILWKTELPGPGASSPTTCGDRIYMTCYTGYGVSEDNPGEAGDLKRNLLCLRRSDGLILWNAAQAATHPQKDYRGFPALHGYASGTPTVDQQGIYVFYGATGAAAYSHDGEQLWLTNLGTDTHGFGTGTSPTLYEDLVIVNASVESGSLIALDKRTGKEVWRQEGIDMSWSTPVLVETAEGNRELVLSMKGQVLAFDPKTGEKLWWCEGIPDYICPTVLVQGDILFALGGRKNTTIAIRAGGRGDVTQSHKLWQEGKGSNVSSPVYHDGHLYWASESRGIVYCANAETGELVYEERLDPKSGLIYASPVYADGKLYYVSRENGTFVLPAEPRYEVLAHNVIATDDSIFNGSPVISDGQILLRSDKYLYCIAYIAE